MVETQGAAMQCTDRVRSTRLCMAWPTTQVHTLSKSHHKFRIGMNAPVHDG